MNPDTRQRVLRSELTAVVQDEELMDELIDEYAAYRLLTLDHDPNSRRPTVEIAHEALLREWQRLRGWLDESRDDLRLRRQLTRAAEEWRQADQDPSFALFNPAATEGIGEELYITGILGFTFGEENIPAIRRAAIGMSITLPGQITSVTGGHKTSDDTARFETSFTRFLVPDDEIFWSVSWRDTP